MVRARQFLALCNVRAGQFLCVLPSKVVLAPLYGPVVKRTFTSTSNSYTASRASSPVPIRKEIYRSASTSASSSPFNSCPIIPKLDLPAIDLKWRSHLTNPNPNPNFTSTSTSTDKKKFYILPMFPYPSGVLHLGHLRVYTISDALSRFRRMQGYDVLHPMGWDSFGLPAENAAIERGVSPNVWTERNVERMREQLGRMGGGFDWQRELMTSSPTYYAHTQRLFLLLYKHGLAYRAESLVNWDPIDKTVLANEQVSASGHSWRSGALVEKKMLKQWFFKITEYAEDLLEGLMPGSGSKALEGWPERVKMMQENWIGKSTGCKVKFKVVGKHDGKEVEQVEVFTTRVDTLHGVQYLALSHSHPLVKQAAEKDKGLRKYLQECSETSPYLLANGNDLPKRGYKLQHLSVSNPLYPSTIDLPIYTAEYVLDGYGSGAVMGVPGHDHRDHAFFTAHFPPWSSPKIVISPHPTEESVEPQTSKIYTKKGLLTPLCGPAFAGLTSSEAEQKLVEDLQVAERTSQYRLRDWLVSRQRYWGAPIPIVHCPLCGEVPVPDDQLPVLLPQGVDISGRGGSPLATAEGGEWPKCPCPQCGGEARRDTDTMDTFVDSSWYFLRFVDPENTKQLFNPEIAKDILPVDVYIGGVEHAILHLLYSRFVYKFLSKISLIPTPTTQLHPEPEPFKTLITQGMVHGKTYTDPSTGRFLKPEELLPDPKNPKEVVFRPQAEGRLVTPNISYEKMSKSKYNGVDPSTTIATWGADATRAHVLFAAPVADVVEWDESKIVGVKRWLGRVWRIVGVVGKEAAATTHTHTHTHTHTAKESESKWHQAWHSPLTSPDPTGLMLSPTILTPVKLREDLRLLHTLHKSILSVTKALSEEFTLNTLVSDLIKLTNEIYGAIVIPDDSQAGKGEISLTTKIVLTRSLLALMAPVCPGVVCEAGEWLGRVTGLGCEGEGGMWGMEQSEQLGGLAWPSSSQELVQRLEGLIQEQKEAAVMASTSTSISERSGSLGNSVGVRRKKVIIQVNSRVKLTLPSISVPVSPSFSSPSASLSPEPDSDSEAKATSALLHTIFQDPSMRKLWFGSTSSTPTELQKKVEIGDPWPAAPKKDVSGGEGEVRLRLKEVMVRGAGGEVGVCVVNFVVG